MNKPREELAWKEIRLLLVVGILIMLFLLLWDREPVPLEPGFGLGPDWQKDEIAVLSAPELAPVGVIGETRHSVFTPAGHENCLCICHPNPSVQLAQ